jgi:hypothetical protein
MPVTEHPRTEPDVHCRVAQPLLAFAPTEPTVRRYRSVGRGRVILQAVPLCVEASDSFRDRNRRFESTSLQQRVACGSLWQVA